VHEHLLSPLQLGIALTTDDKEPLGAPRHLKLLSDELVQLWKREPGWPRKLMVFMPPRNGKSETCSHWFPTWNWALDPATKVIFTSYESEFAAGYGRACRRTVEKHMPVIGVKLMEDSKASHRWETSAGGGMETAGVGGPITGKGCHLLIVDDPVKNAEEATSKVIKDKVWEWWKTTALTRLDRMDSICVLIMTRWAQDDLAGRILASETADQWRVVSLPALAEADDPLGRTPGEALWPDRFNEEWLAIRLKEMSSAPFAALYQQRPAPAEGFAISPEWWQWYDEPPKLEDFDEILQSWDLTFKAIATSDFVCGGVIGRIGGDYYVLDCVHDRLNTPETIRAIQAVSKRWPTAYRKLIEEAASGPAVIQLLSHEMPGIAPIPPVGSKAVRLHWGVSSVAGLIEGRRVWLPASARWAKELVNEFRDFPNAAHDDYVDMLTQGLTYLMPRGWVAESAALRAEKPPQTTREVLDRKLWKKIHEKIKLQAKLPKFARDLHWPS
jgi:predicted phage terminase large subunit-like protein